MAKKQFSLFLTVCIRSDFSQNHVSSKEPFVSVVEEMSSIIPFFAEQDSLHLRDVRSTGDTAEQPRGSRELSTLWGELSPLPHQGSRISVAPGTFPLHISGSRSSLWSCWRLMLYIFLPSLLLCIFSFKNVKGRLGGNSSPEQNSKMVSPFHPSSPQRKWGKELSCQQASAWEDGTGVSRVSPCVLLSFSGKVCFS